MSFVPARCSIWSSAIVASLASVVPLGASAQDAAPATLDHVSPLDPASPLDPMPGLGVDWPDLDSDPVAPGAAEGAARAEALSGDTAVKHYSIRLEGIDGLDPGLQARFDALSTLRAEEKGEANLAQLDRRARTDVALLASLLVALGYYDAVVEHRIGGGADPRVTLVATPGPLYHFTEVRLAGLPSATADAAALEKAFAVKSGDPVNADRVTAGVAALRVELGRRGYPFAKVQDPELVIDREADTAALTLDMGVNQRLDFGAVVVEGKRVFGPRHIQKIARFQPGDKYDAALIEDLRRALVATGLVSSVRLTPKPGTKPGTVDIVADLIPAPPRTVALEAGYGTGEGVRVEASWQHRNFFPPEGAVTFRGVAGTREQLLGAQLRRSNFRQRDQVLNASVSASHSDVDAYDARSFLVGANIERQTNIIWQKTWTWSFGGEFLASDERALSTVTGITTRRTYLIAAAPTQLAYDGSNDLLDPTTGYRLAARVSPEVSLRQGSFAYVRSQIDASAYQPISEGVIVAGRVRFGSIGGASADKIAPSRRFYAGGGGSVRGYGYQEIGPRDADNDPIGGRSLAEFSIEARIRFGNFGVVPFLDGGNLYRSALPKMTGLRYGAGLGVRYHTSFGPIRFDVGTPLNRRAGDSRIAVYVSLGQAF
jgi:translocation and assembly module TamA